MSVNITISLNEESEAAIAAMRAMPDRMLEAMRRGMDRATALTAASIQEKRLSGKGPYPVEEHRLGVVTNRLRSSLRATRAILIRTGNGGVITTSIGSNVKYAGVHEFGYDGDVEVKSFARKNSRGDQFKHQTSLSKNGRFSRSKVKTASGVSVVKSFTRHMHMPARAPIQTGIMENRETFTREISAELIAEWKGGAA